MKTIDNADNNSIDMNVSAVVNYRTPIGGGGGLPLNPIITPDTNETGPTIPEVTDANAPRDVNSVLEVTDTNNEVNPSPATGAFGLIGNDNNSQGTNTTGLFGFGTILPDIWWLLIIPAAIWFYASIRIKNQRLAKPVTTVKSKKWIK